MLHLGTESLLDMKLLPCFQNQYPDLQSTVRPWLPTSQTNANLIALVHSVHSPQAVLERFSQWDISNQAWVNIRGDKILQMFKMSWRSEKQLAVRKCLLVASLCEGPLHGTRLQCVFGVCLSSYESALGETAVCFGKRFLWHLAQILKMLWVILQLDSKRIFGRKELKSEIRAQTIIKYYFVPLDYMQHIWLY